MRGMFSFRHQGVIGPVAKPEGGPQTKMQTWPLEVALCDRAGKGPGKYGQRVDENWLDDS